jgi:hypothetical protein
VNVRKRKEKKTTDGTSDPKERFIGHLRYGEIGISLSTAAES